MGLAKLLFLTQHPWKLFCLPVSVIPIVFLLLQEMELWGEDIKKRKEGKKNPSLCNVAFVCRFLCKYAGMWTGDCSLWRWMPFRNPAPFSRGTSRESSEKEVLCWASGRWRGMPWIRKQNTRCKRGPDAIKSNERISKREAVRAVCLAHWLPAWKETLQAFRTPLEEQDSVPGFSNQSDPVAVLPRSLPASWTPF